jgi:HPt (histidine-containing phosphotransfer) domain-containing protein
VSFAVEKPAAAQGWPDIEGIDAREAQRRLGGRLDLFRAMLRRLLSDFENLDALDLPTTGARMHDLKGIAGTLGAQSIARLAIQVEAACRAGDAAQAGALMRHLGDALTDLRPRAAAVLAAEHGDPADTAPAGALDAQALRELVSQLAHCEMSAMARFDELSARLRRAMGEVPYRAVREQVHKLQFADAARALRTLLSGLPERGA